jgi:hypothetical protein
MIGGTALSLWPARCARGQETHGRVVYRPRADIYTNPEAVSLFLWLRTPKFRSEGLVSGRAVFSVKPVSGLSLRDSVLPEHPSVPSRYGVPQDYAEACFWFDLAAAGKTSSAERVAKFRDRAASHLTPTDQSRVQQRVRKWFEAHQAKPQ